MCCPSPLYMWSNAFPEWWAMMEQWPHHDQHRHHIVHWKLESVSNLTPVSKRLQQDRFTYNWFKCNLLSYN